LIKNTFRDKPKQFKTNVNYRNRSSLVQDCLDNSDEKLDKLRDLTPNIKWKRMKVQDYSRKKKRHLGKYLNQGVGNIDDIVDRHKIPKTQRAHGKNEIHNTSRIE
jgi:2,3-bisphosphoglycerate-independent phosphoglycerate mutase